MSIIGDQFDIAGYPFIPKMLRRPQIAGTSNNSNDNPSNVSQVAIQNDTKDDTKELSGFLQKKERLNDRQKKILYLITEDRKITVSKLSKIINISTATVYRDLKVIGIHWDGPSKTGQWTIDEHLD